MTTKKKKITVQASNRKITYNVKPNWKADTWRPWKITPTVVKILVDAFKIDCTVEEACAYAWVSKVAFYDKINSDENFAYEIDCARKFPWWKAKNILFTSMESDREDIAQKGAIEFLKRREPRYKDKVENAVDMDLDANVEQKVDLKAKSMIDLEDMRKGLLGFK